MNIIHALQCITDKENNLNFFNSYRILTYNLIFYYLLTYRHNTISKSNINCPPTDICCIHSSRFLNVDNKFFAIEIKKQTP